jgi:hypothetical protein
VFLDEVGELSPGAQAKLLRVLEQKTVTRVGDVRERAVDIRVVAADAAGSLDFGRACLRTLLWVLLAMPAGLGFVTTLFRRDRRGLHDRFAGTRVVRASA